MKGGETGVTAAKGICTIMLDDKYLYHKAAALSGQSWWSSSNRGLGDPWTCEMALSSIFQPHYAMDPIVHLQKPGGSQERTT